MRYGNRYSTVLSLCTLFFMTWDVVPSSADNDRGNFASAVVYDLDYGKALDGCQVLMRDGFIGIVREPRLLTLLEGAMKLGKPAIVYFTKGSPNVVHRVVLRQELGSNLGSNPSHDDELYSVAEIDASDTEPLYKVKVMDINRGEQNLFTQDLRMQSILTTALQEGWKVGYLSFDPNTKEIIRGKLNIEDQNSK